MDEIRELWARAWWEGHPNLDALLDARRYDPALPAWPQVKAWLDPGDASDEFERDGLRWLLAEARWCAEGLRHQHVEYLDREPLPWEEE